VIGLYDEIEQEQFLALNDTMLHDKRIDTWLGSGVPNKREVNNPDYIPESLKLDIPEGISEDVLDSPDCRHSADR
jgi:hypothetical protein